MINGTNSIPTSHEKILPSFGLVVLREFLSASSWEQQQKREGRAGADLSLNPRLGQFLADFAAVIQFAGFPRAHIGIGTAEVPQDLVSNLRTLLVLPPDRIRDLIMYAREHFVRFQNCYPGQIRCADEPGGLLRPSCDPNDWTKPDAYRFPALHLVERQRIKKSATGGG